MELQIFFGLLHTINTIAIAALGFAVCTYLPKLKTKLQLAKLPTFSSGGGEKVRQEFLLSSKNMHIQAYKKVRY